MIIIFLILALAAFCGWLGYDIGHFEGGTEEYWRTRECPECGSRESLFINSKGHCAACGHDSRDIAREFLCAGCDEPVDIGGVILVDGTDTWHLECWEDLEHEEQAENTGALS
jgi:hypothetical protein